MEYNAGDYANCGDPTTYEQVPCSPFRTQLIRSPIYEIDPALRQRDWRWIADRYYNVRVTDDLELFFVDTSPFIQEYYNYSWAYDVVGGLANQSTEAQLAFVENALAESTATWRFMVGHHPMYSNGFDGGYAEVREAFQPLIDRYNVTAYLNGHDHSMQHIALDGMHYITSGAGSLTQPGFTPRHPALFEYDQPGFTAYRVNSTGVTMYFFDGEGNGLYNYTIPREEGLEDDGARILAFDGGITVHQPNQTFTV